MCDCFLWYVRENTIYIYIYISFKLIMCGRFTLWALLLANVWLCLSSESDIVLSAKREKSYGQLACIFDL